MKKNLYSLLLILLWGGPFIGWSQQEEISIPSARIQSENLSTESLGDTITIPIEDDFSYPGNLPTPKTWADRKAYVNQTLPLNVKSIGVATLDGLDEFGYAYDINRVGSDTLADVLTSHYIDLSSTSGQVLLSFLYQGGGLGEGPEPDDSIVVDFWSVPDSNWVRVWRDTGWVEDNFRTAIIPVLQTRFLQNGFRFRIGSYGSLQGAFDNWHIDYVNLDDDRNVMDTTVLEPAFVKPHEDITDVFSRIPWFHYDQALVRDTLDYVYRRNGPPPPGGWSLNLGRYEVKENGSVISTRTSVPLVTTLNHNVDLPFQAPLNLPALSPIDEFVIDMKTWFDGTAEGLRQNDTVRLHQEFKNYYAFDDGTAERAYGIKNVFGAITVIRFNPLQGDEFRGLYINFTPTEDDVTKNSFQIGIWEDNNGQPGIQLYLSDTVFKPDYGYVANDLLPYIIDSSGIQINGPVFVGVRQTRPEPLNIGLDLNHLDRTQIWYGDGGNWYQSLTTATLMMRPIMRYNPRDLDIPEREIKAPVAFPNPGDGLIQLQNTPANTTYQVIDVYGRPILQGTLGQEGILDLRSMQRGMYLLQLHHPELGGQRVIKLILN